MEAPNSNCPWACDRNLRSDDPKAAQSLPEDVAETHDKRGTSCGTTPVDEEHSQHRSHQVGFPGPRFGSERGRPGSAKSCGGSRFYRSSRHWTVRSRAGEGRSRGEVADDDPGCWAGDRDRASGTGACCQHLPPRPRLCSLARPRSPTTLQRWQRAARANNEDGRA